MSTRFTKVLYAQVKSQQFSAPVAWKDIVSSPETGAVTNSDDPKRYSMLELGMKVTSGFEMLLTDAKNGDNRTVREVKILLEDLAADDSSNLSTNDEIAGWKDVKKEDDESWMDINFEDFERELKGERKNKSMPSGVFGPELPSGFGDAKTQADLRKMVERFESFLNDENAGIDGAEMDDMDIDDDEDNTDDASEDEDKDVSFDEKEFARMMREMMGMPSDEQDEVTHQPPTTSTQATQGSRIEEVDTSDEEDDVDEVAEMRKVMEKLEADLNEAGALNLDPTPTKLAALKGKARGEQGDEKGGDSEEESDDEDIDIDFNLAKNLLESFKSQAGMAGPGGNLLGMMGMQLPRDEEDHESAQKRT